MEKLPDVINFKYNNLKELQFDNNDIIKRSAACKYCNVITRTTRNNIRIHSVGTEKSSLLVCKLRSKIGI
jgi:hypothetical protein